MKKVKLIVIIKVRELIMCLKLNLVRAVLHAAVFVERPE